MLPWTLKRWSLRGTIFTTATPRFHTPDKKVAQEKLFLVPYPYQFLHEHLMGLQTKPLTHSTWGPHPYLSRFGWVSPPPPPCFSAPPPHFGTASCYRFEGSHIVGYYIHVDLWLYVDLTCMSSWRKSDDDRFILNNIQWAHGVKMWYHWFPRWKTFHAMGELCDN